MRRIKKGKIKFLSLCPQGANKLPTLFKADGHFEVNLLSKGMDEQGELLAVVYAPEFRDSQGDIASAQVIKDMLYDASKRGLEIDLQHDGKAISKDKAFVAESFLIQKGDPRFQGMRDYSGQEVDVAGAWGVVIKVEDEELRAKYRSGEWAGVSMGGQGVFEETNKSDGDQSIYRAVERFFLSNHLPSPTQKDTDVAISKEDLQAIGEIVAASVAKALKPEAEEKSTEDTVEKTEIKFEGDPTNLEDLKKHAAKLDKHKLLNETDWSDPEAVAKLMEGKEDLKADEPKSEDVQKSDADLEIERLEKELKKARMASRQPASSSAKPASNEVFTNVSKEQQDLARSALRAATWANQQRGHKS